MSHFSFCTAGTMIAMPTQTQTAASRMAINR